ncbi:MAG TPA: FAD-dependent oxidoreductase [Mycobacterium sp.]
MAPLKVLICGGGFAAAEALLRLHRLAGQRVTATVVAPNDYLKYRPLTVMAPFNGNRVARYPLGELASATGATLIPGRAVAIEHHERTVHTAHGRSLRYDALLLALGAKERRPNPHVTVFTDRTGGQTYRDVITGIDAGIVTRLAFVEPSGPSWPLPLYELALLTAKHGYDHRLPLEIVFISPHPHLMYPFGADVGATVERLLRDAGIALHLNTGVEIATPRSLRLCSGGDELHPQRIVTLPTITGPNVPGIPGDARDRFIPVDNRCRVRGTDGHVFAAGDATDLPVKHGSLAAQQADVAAAGIAHLAGVAPRPMPFQPVLRGTLLTGEAPLYLEARMVAGTSWRTQILTNPPWPTDQLVVAEELADYLAERMTVSGTAKTAT